MNVKRSAIVGAIAAGGLVLALGNPASACGNDYDDERYGDDKWDATHVGSLHGQWEANHVGTVNAPRTVDDDDTHWMNVIVNDF